MRLSMEERQWESEIRVWRKKKWAVAHLTTCRPGDRMLRDKVIYKLLADPNPMIDEGIATFYFVMVPE